MTELPDIDTALDMFSNAEAQLRAQFRLSREERDYVASHALDSMIGCAEKIQGLLRPSVFSGEVEYSKAASTASRKIAALSNLLGDIGWEQETPYGDDLAPGTQVVSLGELFPVAQLRPWLEEWQRQDNEALVNAEQTLGVARRAYEDKEKISKAHSFVAHAQTKLGTGAILLARIEKWMASHEN